VGASGWQYFTPYREDVAVALEELRQKVFREKSYGDPVLKTDFLEQLKANLSPEELKAFEAQFAQHAELLQGMQEQLEGMQGQQADAETIDELLEMCAESGTHSILDIMQGLSDGPEFGTAFPMPDDVKRGLYGTATPTHDQVEAKMHERADELERWSCWYVIVYKDGRPDEIYFEGCSGD
jgi:hypothetical protein